MGIAELINKEKKMIARRRKTLAVCSKCHAKIDPDRRIRLN